ncbi:MAG TPA: hypothetical protein VIK67_01860 [Acholeplasma sp.]
MNYSKDELEQSLFQLNSMLYKIKTSNDTLTLKKTTKFKSQITLGERRIKALLISIDLIQTELSKL